MPPRDPEQELYNQLTDYQFPSDPADPELVDRNATSVFPAQVDRWPRHRDYKGFRVFAKYYHKIYCSIIAIQRYIKEFIEPELADRVHTLNGLHGDVVLQAGQNVTLTSDGQSIIISSTGGGGGGGGVISPIIPDGPYTKFGPITVPAGATHIDVAFTTPFASANYVVNATPQGPVHAWVDSITKTPNGFRIQIAGILPGDMIINWNAFLSGGGGSGQTGILPDGSTTKFGSATIVSGTSVQVTFTTAFVGNNYSLNLTAYGPSHVWVNPASKTANGFTIESAGPVTDMRIDWTAFKG